MKLGEIKLQLHGASAPYHKVFTLARLGHRSTGNTDAARADIIVSNSTRSASQFVEANVWKFSWLPSEWVAKDNEEKSRASNRRMLQAAKQDVIIYYFKEPGEVVWT